MRLPGAGQVGSGIESRGHGPLLHGRYVTRELVTTAFVAKSFVPPMNDHFLFRNEFADRQMVDFILVLDPDQDGSEGEAGQDVIAQFQGNLKAMEYRSLARAIKKAIHSQSKDQQTINQTAYTPL